VGAVTLGVGPAWPGRTPDGAQPAALAGAQHVSYRGVQMDVPAGWELNPKDPCDPHGRDRVINSDALLRVLCAGPADAATQVGQQVLFGAEDAGPSATVRPFSVDGIRGTLASGTNVQKGMAERALVLPTLGFSVLIEARSAALADRIVASALVIAP